MTFAWWRSGGMLKLAMPGKHKICELIATMINGWYPAKMQAVVEGASSNKGQLKPSLLAVQSNFKAKDSPFMLYYNSLVTAINMILSVPTCMHHHLNSYHLYELPTGT
jgi:hypothetical protein